ncbi:LysM peptidoglycan-binding domain-containing protein [Salmonella enterica]|uniref:LysM peptidoglycan-binding domain-containing protein n=2 Tax=Salmonella enterica TaxID=28901 RepID=A0A639YHZ3_SALER|nr:LysM peptidoglycan-binding domain-containing protein [Salmonella enterica subsp. enterica serovar Pensacola]EAQ4578842.1 LysM peptidoglycan-binding domain-containing protein [Salmonella enterica]EDQ0312421.1 LysM peptidoglycan-binding domain-containing protein [Salmonella enterica subsp. enterica serovar Berta]EAV2403283.1 LysM peptidoglycan-binding domain-containing protein [Salmonella enterica]EAZ4945864.1 LysM peptidoglycan-binding domain-containing protein [Salmonella enterica]
MVNRTASAHKGIPTTENPRERPQVNTRTTGKGSGHPPKKLSPLDEWKAGREKAIGNPDWYIYDNTIRKLVSEINRHLSTSKNIEKYKPLDWKLIKAMIWTETGAAVAAWKTRPIQIGNTGDEGIKEVVIPARPRKYNIIIPKTWNTYLINKTDLIRSNPEYNIRAGIALLMIKMSETEKDKIVYDNENEDTYEVVEGDRGYSSIAKKIGTTQSVLTKLNGVKVIHPGDKLKYKKAHLEQYIPGWLLFTPENIKKQYNIDPTKAQPGHRGDHTYADKIRFTYALIVADESK